jgi:hypothetical protein
MTVQDRRLIIRLLVYVLIIGALVWLYWPFDSPDPADNDGDDGDVLAAASKVFVVGVSLCAVAVGEFVAYLRRQVERHRAVEH